MSAHRPVIAVIGPTASGKSALAVRLARDFGGPPPRRLSRRSKEQHGVQRGDWRGSEIVSVDARQIYRGFDIGTGKITAEETGGVPHHMLDIAEPDDVVTAHDFAIQARAAIDEIHARGAVPILAGGSGFYLSAMLGEIVLPDVAPDYELRKKLETKSAEELMRDLRARDSKHADEIDPHNRRRIIRAIEIYDALGYIPQHKESAPLYDVLKIGITLPPAQLRQKIHDRLRARIEAGMIEEARQLHENGLSYERMEELGLEYRYLARLLKGELSKKEMMRQLETAINQYAKRQMTWFRRDKEIEWFTPSSAEGFTPDDYKAIKERAESFLA